MSTFAADAAPHWNISLVSVKDQVESDPRIGKLRDARLQHDGKAVRVWISSARGPLVCYSVISVGVTGSASVIVARKDTMGLHVQSYIRRPMSGYGEFWTTLSQLGLGTLVQMPGEFDSNGPVADGDFTVIQFKDAERYREVGITNVGLRDDQEGRIAQRIVATVQGQLLSHSDMLNP